MKIDAVLFDMDGLMLDTERLTMKAFDWAGEQLGYQPMGYMVLKTLGMNGASCIKIFADEFPDGPDFDEVRLKSNEFFGQYVKENGVPVKPGLFELLEWLKAKGYKMAVGTSTRESSARPELESAGILPYFDEMVCGDMVAAGKPAPDIFLEAAKRLGVPPERCLVLEDSPNGIRAAYAAGMQPVVIPDLQEPDEEILGKAIRRLQSLYEVPALLTELAETDA